MLAEAQRSVLQSVLSKLDRLEARLPVPSSPPVGNAAAARMGDDPRASVVDADCRSWDIRNLWVCDGSVFPTVGGVNPSLTIQAIACRTGDRIRQMARRGEL